MEPTDAPTREELILGNLGLVGHLAKPFRFRGVPFPDLIQAGCLGLCEAADRFDRDRGVKFGTYARHWISMEIREELRRSRMIRVPRKARPDPDRPFIRPASLEFDPPARGPAPPDEIEDAEARAEHARALARITHHALARITPRDRGILERYFGLGEGDGREVRSYPGRAVAELRREIGRSTWRRRA